MPPQWPYCSGSSPHCPSIGWISDGALREGLLYEFEERLQHHDIRERTALALSSHYHIDKRQATRVEQSVLALFDAQRSLGDAHRA